MRVGTWNLEGRWGDRHRSFLKGLDCDVLLLTEVRSDFAMQEYGVHASGEMVPGRWFAAVASGGTLSPLTGPHGASAMATVEGVAVCSSVLPWAACGHDPPWTGANTAEKTVHAVAAIASARPHIWGGDWNHSLSGHLAGTRIGKAALLAAVDDLGLHVPTTSLPHRNPDLRSIDHIAVPATWQVSAATRIDATGLSDHDAYVVETGPGSALPTT
jgi:hypothetical protein